jgi:hypothetical protein
VGNCFVSEHDNEALKRKEFCVFNNCDTNVVSFLKTKRKKAMTNFSQLLGLSTLVLVIAKLLIGNEQKGSWMAIGIKIIL